jgi:NADH-quinone oxidoreductase subunit L
MNSISYYKILFLENFNLESYLFFTLCFPLLSFLSICFFGWFLGNNGASLLAIICMLTNLLYSVFIAIGIYKSEMQNMVEIYLQNSDLFYYNTPTTSMYWIKVGSISIQWRLLGDMLTVTMLLVVNIVSTLVHIYSWDYMALDAHLARFMSFLSLFTFFMLILITSGNIVVLFVGWEGVGLCSYLSISYWAVRIQANKAAIKAMLINRIADIGLCVGIILIFYTTKSLDFQIFLGLIPYYITEHVSLWGYSVKYFDMASVALFIGSMGKSAQIGLHTWLPDAMEGPTPVSALIHAATMVTAGVFLIIRCSPLFEYTPAILCFITIIGSCTAFFGALSAIGQFDIKKMIAYSTCSQLGYMIFCCGLSDYAASLYHLTNHAFFKALLFLGSGAIIHAVCNEQDIRKMGGLVIILPYTYTIMLIGSLALIGFPFTSGFYSKDIILELAHEIYYISWTTFIYFGLVTVLCTAYYSTRLLYVSFLMKPNGYRKIIESVHEAPLFMALPLFLLSIFSIFSGNIIEEVFVGVGSDFFKNCIFLFPLDFKLFDAEIISTITQEKNILLKLHPLQFTIIGCCIAIYRYTKIKWFELFLIWFVKFIIWFAKLIWGKPIVWVGKGSTRHQAMKKPFTYIYKKILPFIKRWFWPYASTKPFPFISKERWPFKNHTSIHFIFPECLHLLELEKKEPKVSKMLTYKKKNSIFAEWQPKPKHPWPRTPYRYVYHIVHNPLSWLNFPKKKQNFFKFTWKYFIKYHLLVFLNQKFFFDKLYNQIIGNFILKEAYQTGIKTLDKGFLETYGPSGLIHIAYIITISIKRAHSGYIWHYISFVILIFLIIHCCYY